MIQENFKTKLSNKNKLQAFNLWIQCIDYQFSTEESKIKKRNELLIKDSDFSFHADKNKLVDSGIVNVKGSAFLAFQFDFIDYVQTTEFKTLVKDTNSNICESSRSSVTGRTKESMFEAKSVLSINSNEQRESNERLNTAR